MVLRGHLQPPARSDKFVAHLEVFGHQPAGPVFFVFLGTTIFFLAIQTFLLTPYGGEVLALPVAETSRFGIYTTYGILVGMVGVHLLVSAHQNWANKIVLVVSLVVGAAAFGLLSLSSFTPNPTWGICALWLLGAGPAGFTTSGCLT